MEEAGAIKRAGRIPGIQRGLQQGKGAEHTGLQESFGVGGRPVVRLCGQMRDPRALVLLKQPPHQGGISARMAAATRPWLSGATQPDCRIQSFWRPPSSKMTNALIYNGFY